MPGNNNVEGTAAAAAAMSYEVGSHAGGAVASELNNNQTERFEEGRENSHKENDSSAW